MCLMKVKKYSNSTLMRMTKPELIAQLRCAEYNRTVAEEALAQQAENVKNWEPVVHCKDCKHFNFTHMECENDAVSTDHEGGAQHSLNFGLDDFCSYGERKENNHEKV